ncbi:TldD/PmbA family protein [Gloeobacter kilaueensis]|uniref:Peptidase U62 modulator of DNA gyrase n=1 Tax=Gloeobacter kilaueensis (strain ATCC BAA-2537 / CCAP 1431/1 / ULC 316 / JS1) TaxID=1183438 RepID=U5QQG5_GLOK1|nr:metallopeptidase TldD-related protein [Gloeobacter kilaueensis]AGY59925.1 peptidase U62 modulator of DNA gyrase [Gloeobacter kilaueensis JS1]
MDPQQLLELAQAAGAEAAEVYQSSGFGRSANFEANRLKQIESGDEQGVALRVWRAGKPGLAVARGPVDGALLVEKALALSAFGLPEEPALTTEAVAVTDAVSEAVPIERLIAWGCEAIDQIRTAFPEVLCSCTMSDETGSVRLINTGGLDLHYASSSRSGFVGAEWVRGEDFLQVYDGQTVLGEPEPAAIAEPVRRRLEWARKNSATLKRAVPVLFTAKAASVLLGSVIAALSGRQVYQQASPWTQRRGEVVLSPLLNLHQDPHLAPYITPFDDEGTATRALNFVQGGRLETFYADRRTAHRLGLSPAGNGLRPDLGSYPQPGLFNLIVEPGSGSWQDLVGSLKDGIIVDQVLGGGAGLSGEFSVNIDLGFRVRRGEITGRIKDTMVAGNAYALLNRLAALGSERSWEGNLLTPALLVESLAVTGRGD